MYRIVTKPFVHASREPIHPLTIWILARLCRHAFDDGPFGRNKTPLATTIIALLQVASFKKHGVEVAFTERRAQQNSIQVHSLLVRSPTFWNASLYTSKDLFVA